MHLPIFIINACLTSCLLLLKFAHATCQVPAKVPLLRLTAAFPLPSCLHKTWCCRQIPNKDMKQLQQTRKEKYLQGVDALLRRQQRQERKKEQTR